MKPRGILAAIFVACACTARPGTPVTTEIVLTPVDEDSPRLMEVARALMEQGPQSGIRVDDISPGRPDAPAHRFHIRGRDLELLSRGLEQTELEPESGHSFATQCGEAGLDGLAGGECELLYLYDDEALRIGQGGFARVDRAEDGTAFVLLTLPPADGEAFEALTREFVGHRMAMTLRGTVMSSPVIAEPIAGHRLHIAPGDADEGYAESIFAELTEPVASPAAGG